MSGTGSEPGGQLTDPVRRLDEQGAGTTEGRVPPAPPPPAAPAPRAWRATAAAGLVVTVLGCLLLVRMGAHTLAKSYVSHHGAVGEPRATAFQVGLLVCSVGVGLVALAAWRLGSPAVRVGGTTVAGAATLLCGAVFLGLTAAVPCTPGCPLPPYGTPTTRDWVHAVVAVAAFVAASAAMAVYAAAGRTHAVRVVSLVAAVLVAGCAALGALLALVDVPTRIGGTLERVAAAVALAWVLLVAVRLVASPVAPIDRRHRPGSGGRSKGDVA